MPLRYLVTTFALLLALLIPLPVAAKAPGNQTIAEIALGDPDNFSTLVAALSCTDLVGAVSGKKPLTVFAPTNAAFGALGLNADNICATFDTETLSNILLYHVTKGVRLSQSVLDQDQINMLNGDSISVSSGGTISAANSSAGIADPDIRAKNGVIHVIDAVLLP